MERFSWRDSSPSPQPSPLETEKLFCIDLLANCPVNYSTAERFSKKALSLTPCFSGVLLPVTKRLEPLERFYRRAIPTRGVPPAALALEQSHASDDAPPG
jgi:hypothetical protein